MKTQNGFTLLENKEDVRKWLNVVVERKRKKVVDNISSSNG